MNGPKMNTWPSLGQSGSQSQEHGTCAQDTGTENGLGLPGNMEIQNS